MTLLLFVRHRNKENESSSLNGAAYQSHRRRSTALNPYVTRKKVPTKSAIAFSQDSSQDPSSMASSAALAIIEEEETSPTIRRILEATGCSSRQELLAMRAAQANQQGNTNGSTNPSKSTARASNRPTATAKRSKSINGTTKGSKSTNGSKAALNVATNGTKAPNGSKATTNPKKKAKSKCFC